MNRLDLEGHVAVITGGAQGIGYAVAERMLASGAEVSLWDMNAAALDVAAGSLPVPQRVSTALVDITDAASVEEAMGATLARHRQVDVLVNSAGITGGNGCTWELDPRIWRKVIEVNLVGTYLVCRAIVPHMVANGYGRIVNIASVAGKEGNPNASHYSASKADVIGFTKSLAKELAATGVVVNTVTPGAAKTPLFDSMSEQHIAFMLSKIPMGRFLEVSEAASMIGWLATRECSFSTGATFDLSGGRATY